MLTIYINANRLQSCKREVSLRLNIVTEEDMQQISGSRIYLCIANVVRPEVKFKDRLQPCLGIECRVEAWILSWEFCPEYSKGGFDGCLRLHVKTIRCMQNSPGIQVTGGKHGAASTHPGDEYAAKLQ